MFTKPGVTSQVVQKELDLQQLGMALMLHKAGGGKKKKNQPASC